jgi:hypothetical protein
VLDIWPYRGSIEFYFKHRYQKTQRKLGPLTEYFLFQDIKPVLSHDLRRMPDKTLSAFELDIYHRRGSTLEQEIEAAAIESRRRARIAEGMHKAQAKGRTIGRPKGQEDTVAFLSKPSALAVIDALNQGLSIREAAAAAGVSPATVQKVKQAMSALKSE